MKLKNSIPICIAEAIALSACSPKSTVRHPYTQEYIPGEGNIQGEVDAAYFEGIDSRFAIGAEGNGKAVFKQPEKAFEALTEKYSAGILLIQQEFDLAPLSKSNYGDYKAYGWQATGGTRDERGQAGFVSAFMDIYENSFE